TLFEVLKEFLQDVNIEFKQDREKNDNDDDEDDDYNVSRTKTANNDSKNEGGGHIKIFAMDPTKSIVIMTELKAKNFDVFKVAEPICDVGISVIQFYKTIKHLDSSDVLTIEIDEDDRHNLILCVENEEKRTCERNVLKTLDINKQQLNLPTKTFDIIVTMEAAEFHKICKVMATVGPFVEIICSGDHITFTCKGDSLEKTIKKNIGDTRIKTGVDKKMIVQGMFDLKNFTMIAKSSTLCND